MDKDELDKYEQIRSIAGRNWLKGASVSLAKLDQVKARVYNMGFADSKDIRANSRQIARKALAAPEETPAAEPPLSKLTLQRNSWGSNTSIPELIKNQSEKQRIRPQSAKHQSKTRPLSGKSVRRRPHSAKETGKPPMHPGDLGDKGEQAALGGVRGEKYDPAERPPDGVHMHSVTFGWVAPPGGLVETPSESAKAPPPPPRGSPDFEQILLSEGPDSVTQPQVNDLAAGERSPRLLRRPTPEPVHVQLSLPQATLDDDDDDGDEMDTERLLQTEVPRRPSITSDMVSVTDVDSSTKYSEDVRADFEQELSSILKDECSRVVNNAFQDDNRSKKSGVVFADDRNITVDITPRINEGDANVEQTSAPDGDTRLKPRSYTGKPEIRRVRSRTDSGMVLKSKVLERRHTCSDLANKAPADLSVTGVDQRKNLVSRRPKSSRSRLSTGTASVEYIEEEADEPKGDEPPRRDVETMMSKLALSEGKTADTVQPSSNRPLATKTVSSSGKNYYELGRQANKTVNQNKPPQNVKKVVVTTKMISLAEDRGDVQETTSVNVVDIPVHQTRPLEPVAAPHAARPPSAKQRQVKKPPVATNKQSEDTDSLEDHRDSPSPPPRPESRAENREEQKTHAAMLKKRRIISAPSVRSKGKKHDKSLPGCDKQLIQSQSTICSINSRVSSADARRANAAVRALKQDRSMSRRFNRKKDQTDAEPGEVIEIWTRRHELVVETDGVKECQELHNRLMDNGVPVSVETLTRALLPPTEYGFQGASFNSNAQPSLPCQSSGLLSRPCTWFPEEFRRLQQAEKAVRLANASIMEQEREERLLFQGTRKKKRVKGKSKGRRRRAMSAV